MRKVNLVDYSDLIGHGEELGYGWNGTIDIFDKDDFGPRNEMHKVEYYIEEFEEDNSEYNYSKEVRHIVKDFMLKHKVKKITVVED